MKITPQHIVAALAELGGDSKTVARSLRRMGIKGLPKTPAQCPIANYLRQRFEKPILVGAEYVKLAAEINLPLPPPCRRFVKSFDADKYRKLRSDR